MTSLKFTFNILFLSFFCLSYSQDKIATIELEKNQKVVFNDITNNGNVGITVWNKKASKNNTKILNYKNVKRNKYYYNIPHKTNYGSYISSCVYKLTKENIDNNIINIILPTFLLNSSPPTFPIPKITESEKIKFTINYMLINIIAQNINVFVFY